MSSASDDLREWLEPDGLGGFASGTASGIRTRRYHATLLAAVRRPAGRMVLVNGFEAWLEIGNETVALTSQRYAPDVLYPDGAKRIYVFSAEPWPRWTYLMPDGMEIEHGVMVAPGRAAAIVYWRMRGEYAAKLAVRPLMSGRDYHSTHHENSNFDFQPQLESGRVVFHPYPGVPGVAFRSDAAYTHEPDWYRNFLYIRERERGLDSVEDLASPGIFRWDLGRGEAIMIVAAEGGEPAEEPAAARAAEESRRAALRSRFPSRLERAASAYIVARGQGRTIIAGYPWFTDWGRDTFISLRGLCLATGRFDEARQILLEWAGAVDEGMVPNRFTDGGAAPEFNSVDASLWYIVAVDALLRSECALAPAERARLGGAVLSILEGYAAGTRFRIAADADGLIAAGVAGVQLTWMDAKAGDWVVTPRIGKPVEVQALWLNALLIGARFERKWAALYEKASAAFADRFWNQANGCLYDVIDCDHQAGAVDAAFRPNQIFAIGGLPFQVLTGVRARQVVDAVEARLLTAIGLRSLAPGEPNYAPHYGGDQRARDAAYHQGTVWPYLMGPFVEAWVRVRGETSEARREARNRFLTPLLAHLDQCGLGHLPEIADGDAPHTPRGCPFQAWSVAEALRLRAWLG